MGTQLQVMVRSAAVSLRRYVLICYMHQSGLILSKDSAIKTATSELRQLLERFAHGQSMDGIFDACQALIDVARHDEEFRDWFRRLNVYIRKVSNIHRYPAQHTYGCVGLA